MLDFVYIPCLLWPHREKSRQACQNQSLCFRELRETLFALMYCLSQSDLLPGPCLNYFHGVAVRENDHFILLVKNISRWLTYVFQQVQSSLRGVKCRSITTSIVMTIHQSPMRVFAIFHVNNRVYIIEYLISYHNVLRLDMHFLI